MFICQQCTIVPAPGEKPVTVVIETRQRHYPEHNTYGKEIVKEIKLCQSCAEKVII